MTSPMPYERASANDLMHLAYHRPQAPAQVGGLLLVGGPAGIQVDQLSARLAGRIAATPRLRQRLLRLPPGCGRPIWIDDEHFDLDRHLTSVRCPAPGDEAAVLALANRIVGTPLPVDRPLWSMTLIEGLPGQRAAVLITLHHTLADGQRALGLLGSLADRLGDQASRGQAGGDPASRGQAAGDPASRAQAGGDPASWGQAGELVLTSAPAGTGFPRPRPGVWHCAATASADRVRSVGRLVRGLPRLLNSLRELRLGTLAPAPRCSLNRPSGPLRRLMVVRTDLAGALATAHAAGASVNDLVLASVTGALHRLLRARGEVLDELAVAIFVSARSRAGSTNLGNRVGVIPATVPASGPRAERLARTAALTSARLRRIAEVRGTSAGLLETLFRAAGGLGLANWYFARQRRVNTFVTTLHGPARRVTLLGAPIEEIIAVPNLSGNLSVIFAAVRYAGRLTVSVLADPDHCPDQAALIEYLAGEFSGFGEPRPVRSGDPGHR